MNLTSKALSEFLGTFFFIGVILAYGANEFIGPLAIAAGLFAAVLMFGKVSGSFVNPAITLVMWMKGKLDTATAVVYVLAQLIGGLVALLWYSKLGS